MIYVMIVVICGFVLCVSLLLSKGKYNDILDKINKKEYALKSLIPAGLYIIDKINYSFDSDIDNKILRLNSILHGFRNGKFHMKLFYSNGIVQSLIIVIILNLIAYTSVAKYQFFIVIVLLLIIINYLNYAELVKKCQQRKLEINLEFPDFLNRLILLLNAGMTITNAWIKIANSSMKKSPLYKEIINTAIEIKNGKSEYIAYENFSMNCREQIVARFISLVIQNLKKGSYEMLPAFKALSKECWDSRKNMAKQIGEKASSKILFPMSLMLLSIIIMLMTPALIQLNSIQ